MRNNLSKKLSTDLFERPDWGQRAILVHIDFSQTPKDQEYLAEFRDLVTSAGIEIIDVITGSRQIPNPKFFIGTGKVQELSQAVEKNDVQLVLFNHTLTPGQERNLEKELQSRVIDRTGLILDIFAQRARSFEGKLQVELAQLQHLSTRLVRGWSHLERQRGGIGLRGPGETQLETDRRLLRERVKAIKKRLEKVRSQREQGRRYRQKSATPTISLVGYTNAGKSTLFNHLTSADVYVANKLFATLDPTLRKIKLPELGEAVIADTVGFVRHLPHDLVEAFSATLEETVEADLLLHVVDASDPRRHELIQEVNEVLSSIHADTIQQLMVFNKVDLLPNAEPRIDYDDNHRPIRVFISALTDQGFDLLAVAISQCLLTNVVRCDVHLGPHEGKERAALLELDGVLYEEEDGEGGWFIGLRIQEKDYQRIFS